MANFAPNASNPLMQAGQGQAPPISSWGLRYGVRFDTKSGWSPIFTQFPSHPEQLTPEELKDLEKIKEIEAFQRKTLHNFTTRELIELDAISGRRLKAPSLANPIHPMIRQERWEETLHPAFPRRSLFPIGGNHQGNWVASNPVVYEVFEPVLRLVSRILLSMQMLPWFDALMLGEKRVIPPERIPPGATDNSIDPNAAYTSFHRRPGPMTQERQDQSELVRDSVFSTLANQFDLYLGFFPNDISPDDGREDSIGHAVTLHSNAGKEIFNFISIWLCIDDVQGLLDPTINDGERLGLHWFLANAVVHEFMHAIWMVLWETEGDFKARFRQTDPYFEDEPVAELGCSMEQAMFRGTSSVMPYSFGGTHFGHWLEHWPTIESIELSDGVVMLYPNLEPARKIFPVHVSFYEDLHQEEFWDIGVRRFGFQLIRDRNLRVGIQEQLDVTWTGAREPDISNANVQPYKFAAVPALPPRPSQEDLLRMSPLERRSDALGRNFLLSCVIEGTFVKHSAHVAYNMAHIIEEAASKGQYGNVLIQQKMYIMEALKSHAIATRCMVDAEETDGTVYGDRRQNLLHWNKGMRTYLTGIEDMMKVNAPAASRERPLKDELLLLERCRMTIVCPLKGDISGQEIEDKRLGPAFQAKIAGNNVLCLQLCSDVVGIPGCTLLDACSARVLAAGANPSISQATRMNEIALSINELNQLKAPHPELACPQPWIEVLDNWLQVAQAIQGAIENEIPDHLKR